MFSVHDLFPLHNAIPSTKAISVFRKDPFKLSIDYARPDLLTPSTDVHIADFLVPTIPKSKEESPKIKIIVKLDVNGLVNVDGAEFVETVEEEAAATTPAPNTETPKPEEKKEGTEETKEGTEEKKEEKKDEKPAEKKDDKPAAKKKKVLKSELTVKAENKHISSSTQLEKWTEVENQFIQSDRLVAETGDAKNAVESYVYNMRSKLNGALNEFISPADKEAFLKVLSDTEEWLYGEGEDATKSVYQVKLVSLRTSGDPVENRSQESQNRYSTLDSVRKSLSAIKLAATSAVSFK